MNKQDYSQRGEARVNRFLHVNMYMYVKVWISLLAH